MLWFEAYRVDLDEGKWVIQKMNTLRKILEDSLKTFKYMQEFKTQDGRSLDKYTEKRKKDYLVAPNMFSDALVYQRKGLL